MAGYKGGIVGAWVVIFIGALICSIVRLGFLPGLEHGWLTAVIAAFVLCWIWPLPVLAVIALLVWTLPPPRLGPAAHPHRRNKETAHHAGGIGGPLYV